jgi:signal transduction histidine kinase
MPELLVFFINDLIDFNKIEANDLKTEQNIFVLQHLVEDIETLFRQSVMGENVELLVDMTKVIKSAFGDGTQLLLKGDDGKIRRIIINLLLNVGDIFCEFPDSVLSFLIHRHTNSLPKGPLP